jgi:hypothetical protein
MVLSLLGVFIVALLVFCVLVVVMAVLRPSVFSSFVRGFTHKDAEPDEEMQKQMKFINWKKGFFRLTLVLSVLLGIFAGINAEIDGSSGVFLQAFLGFFGLTWLIYFAIGFVVRGFASKR